MSNKITQELYGGRIKVDFYPDSHRYRRQDTGEYLISVTGATGMVNNSGPLLIWATRLAENYLKDVLNVDGRAISEMDITKACGLHKEKKEEAADIGTMIHEWIEKYTAGQNPEMPEDEKVMNGVLAFLKWVDQNGIKFVFSERLIYSEKYGYVGLCDNGFTMAKEDHKILHINDYKSSSGIHAPYYYQRSGYEEAIIEELGKKPFGLEVGDGYILRFAKEDKFDKNGNLIEEAGTFEAVVIPKEDQPAYFECFLGCLALKRMDKKFEKAYYDSLKK